MFVFRSTHEYIVGRLEGELSRLEQLLTTLQDRLYVLERRKAGMSEVPRDQAPAPKRKAVRMPAECTELLAGFDSPTMRGAVYQRCLILHEDGVPWDEITRRIREEYDLP